MTDSDSSLSSPPSTDDEMVEAVAPVKVPATTPQKKKKKKNGTILSFFKSPSPVRKKRPASPTHEPVPEDNPDIAFIVMFRSRFTDAFPPKSPHFGPQDLERGVAEGMPSPQIESLLCALLALLLNRKKPVEKGHYGRALEEAIQTHRLQWPSEWKGVNPLNGGRSFNTMTPAERLTLFKNLVLWALHDSEVVNNMIKDSYKSRTSKEKNDTNIPLSVQPWGRDGDSRRYWLVEGQDNTPFRVYRESNPKLKTVTWWNVAGSIDDIRALAQKLDDEDGTREAKQLSEKMRNALPRFEATEEKRKRREYRLGRQAAFTRPEPGFSLYEGRTRGKRMKYTFSDEEEEYSDALGIRRSNRHSGRDTPAAPSGPTVTASGRQVRSRATGLYGEILHAGQVTDAPSPASGDYARSDASEEPQPHGRPTRGNANAVNGAPRGRKHIETYNSVDEMDDEDDATSWDGGDEDEEDDGDQMDLNDDEDDDGGVSSGDDEPKRLVVRLRYPKGAFDPAKKPVQAQTAPPGENARRSAPSGPPPVVNALPPALASAAAQPTTAPPPQTAAVAPQNGIAIQQPPSFASGIQQLSTPPGNDVIPPKVESHFSAPTPPYVAPVETAHVVRQPAAPPQYQPDALPPNPFQPAPLPHPTPASTWQ
ncbi:hypothetical protein K491DRAFT_602307 [Lophiostoma macrostomum CBS 122681]|uniref:WHIM1 domain-containing protein n=1 Tax=Lophiostoma macrostomum CBS 122681 TaxID=1314788 RepID=A0A6A6T342_9PLEO|nr:hypothetical protein K491DRAFT_602307 [Lophiostoma macrostomum CBS 122681]